MEHDQYAAVAAATVADDARSALLADLLGRVAGCFPRRETRQCCGQMVRGLLMELDDHNCWTIAEAADAAGAARQYSGTLGGVALCQVTVTLAYATRRGHALIGRALYLPEGGAADEEHRELAGVPEEVMFATKPRLASASAG